MRQLQAYRRLREPRALAPQELVGQGYVCPVFRRLSPLPYRRQGERAAQQFPLRRMFRRQAPAQQRQRACSRTSGQQHFSRLQRHGVRARRRVQGRPCPHIFLYGHSLQLADRPLDRRQRQPVLSRQLLPGVQNVVARASAEMAPPGSRQSEGNRPQRGDIPASEEP